MARSKAPARKEGEETTDKDLEALRISYGFWLVVGALLVTLLVLVITLTAMAPEQPKTADIVAIIGAVTGVIGTLTAAFFGIQAAGALAGADHLGQHPQEPRRRSRAHPDQA